MAKNLIPEVCKVLGVELGEEFRIDGYTDNFRISESTLELECDVTGKWEGEWSCLFYALLQGEREIIKLPWKPKDKEEFWGFYLLPNGILMSAKRQWNDQNIEYLAMYKAGWVYRTREEAETALPRVAKELGVEYEQ